jgi:hypothetical protein
MGQRPAAGQTVTPTCFIKAPNRGSAFSGSNIGSQFTQTVRKTGSFAAMARWRSTIAVTASSWRPDQNCCKLSLDVRHWRSSTTSNGVSSS